MANLPHNTTDQSEADRRAKPQRVRRPPLLRRRTPKSNAERRPWVNPWNLANLLSIMRILATVPLVLLILTNTASSYFWVFWLFAVVAITDTIDGRLARRYGWVSNIGIFLDLTADKIYTAGILVAMVKVNILDPWAAIIILIREFVVTGLRSFAAAEGLVIPAGRWGKLKMMVTILAIGWIFTRANVDRGGWLNNLGAAFQWITQQSSWVLWAAVVLTILSGLEYVWAARSVFQKPPRSSQS